MDARLRVVHHGHWTKCVILWSSTTYFFWHCSNCKTVPETGKPSFCLLDHTMYISMKNAIYTNRALQFLFDLFVTFSVLFLRLVSSDSTLFCKTVPLNYKLFKWYWWVMGEFNHHIYPIIKRLCWLEFSIFGKISSHFSLNSCMATVDWLFMNCDAYYNFMSSTHADVLEPRARVQNIAYCFI